MAGATGLEPATSGVTGRRSNQLSYTPANLDRGATSYLGGVGVSSNSPASAAAVEAAMKAPAPVDARSCTTAQKSVQRPPTSQSP
jgi:hypothetical protein